MEYIPWFMWIVLAGILAGTVITVVNSVGNRKSELTTAMQQQTEANKQLAARLDAIESRLTSVEKTLNEIPE